MDGSAILIMWAFLTLGLGFVLFIIAADKKRFLARFDLALWREGYYLRSLPNFLQALHDNHFRTAWPAHCDALSSAYFRYRAWFLLGRKPRKLRRAFLQQHI